MDFYGRDELLVDLDSLWGKNSPSPVTCRGRRRIGKSTLIARFAELSNARFIKIEGERPDSILRRDFDEMFKDVIAKRPRMVATALEALVDGPMTMSEISGAISVGVGGNVSAALDQLVEAGPAARDRGMNPETGDEIRERRYRLSDNYVRFYLKCIRPAAKTIDAGTFRYFRLARFEEWNAVRGFAFENLIVNHYGELLPHLHLGESHVYSAVPYRKNGPKGKGFQIDLLIQTRRSQCVVEIKRKNTIGRGVVDEVAEKVRRLKHDPVSLPSHRGMCVV